MEFRSEFGEDQWIFENLHGKLPLEGFYVDAGCLWPERMSNTFFLRQIGWDGLAIDANAEVAREWAANDWVQRPMIVAVLSDEPTGTFKMEENALASRMDPSGLPVQCRTLESILLEHKAWKVDLLSIDIEGHEFNVMKGLDYALHDPSIIIAEYSTKDLGEDFRLREFLEGKGYKVVHTTTANFIYTKEL